VRETTIPTLVVDTTEQAWPRYQEAVARFLGLPPVVGTLAEDLADYLDMVSYVHGDTRKSCEIRLEGDDLYAYGAPRLWATNRLIRIARDRFVAAALPIEADCERDAGGIVQRARMTGPELLDGTVNWILEKG
jgi:hypothetical protein